MASETVRSPGVITLTPSNWFHEGWLYGLLGMPPREFTSVDRPVRDVDIDAWREGYETAGETQSVVVIARAFQRMHNLGQIVIDIQERRSTDEAT